MSCTRGILRTTAGQRFATLFNEFNRSINNVKIILTSVISNNHSKEGRRMKHWKSFVPKITKNNPLRQIIKWPTHKKSHFGHWIKMARSITFLYVNYGRSVSKRIWDAIWLNIQTKLLGSNFKDSHPWPTYKSYWGLSRYLLLWANWLP